MKKYKKYFKNKYWSVKDLNDENHKLIYDLYAFDESSNSIIALNIEKSLDISVGNYMSDFTVRFLNMFVNKGYSFLSFNHDLDEFSNKYTVCRKAFDENRLIITYIKSNYELNFDKNFDKLIRDFKTMEKITYLQLYHNLNYGLFKYHNGLWYKQIQ